MLNGQSLGASLGTKRPLVEPPAVAGSVSKFAPLDISGSVLNALNPDAVRFVLQGEGEAAVRSDCDEQLLFSIEFAAGCVKCQSILIEGPEDAAPRTVKLFVNRINMSFDDCEDMPPTQTLELSSASSTTNLNFVKFQSVTSLTLFVENNLAGGDVTAVSRITIVGQPLATTNVSAPYSPPRPGPGPGSNPSPRAIGSHRRPRDSTDERLEEERMMLRRWVPAQRLTPVLTHELTLRE